MAIGNQSGASNDFISNFGSVLGEAFTNSLGVLSRDVFPRWVQQQLIDEQKPTLLDPLKDRRFFPTFFTGTTQQSPTTSARRVGFLTGTDIGDAVIIGGVVLIGILLILKS